MTRGGEAMTCHVSGELFEAYDQGRLDPSRVMAVDAHLQVCPVCRGAVPIDVVWLDRNFSVVLDAVQYPATHRAERVLQRLGLPAHRLRLLSATPALRWSWLASTAAVLA